jgi:hypothetical protein
MDLAGVERVVREQRDAQPAGVGADFLREGTGRRRCRDRVAGRAALQRIEHSRGVAHRARHAALHHEHVVEGVVVGAERRASA